MPDAEVAAARRGRQREDVAGVAGEMAERRRRPRYMEQRLRAFRGDHHGEQLRAAEGNGDDVQHRRRSPHRAACHERAHVRAR